MTIAFKMKLKPGAKEEYAKRHQALWPEVEALLKARGVSNYSIFYDAETDILFAVQQVDKATYAYNNTHEAILHTWWNYMADIMDVNADNSPVIVNLEQVFHLD